MNGQTGPITSRIVGCMSCTNRTLATVGTAGHIFYQEKPSGSLDHGYVNDSRRSKRIGALLREVPSLRIHDDMTDRVVQR